MVEAAERLAGRLGKPLLGVVLGSGFSPAVAGLGGAAASVEFRDVPGMIAPTVDGHGGRIDAYPLAGGNVWVFDGRLHLYEGHPPDLVAQAVRVLAAAGARAVLLTCAAGGLLDSDLPGSFAAVADHLNLTGADPTRGEGLGRGPRFVDLQGAYDREFLSLWEEAARRARVPLRRAVLAGVAGPCYETPAEVRMLRTLGADAVTMSVVVETIAARALGLRVAAIACIANVGAGLAPARLEHEDVLATVRAASAAAGTFFRDGLQVMTGAAGEA
jgi:purine-nucleoside phosphorylase